LKEREREGSLIVLFLFVSFSSDFFASTEKGRWKTMENSQTEAEVEALGKGKCGSLDEPTGYHCSRRYK
jgi:hypothetical protein